MTKPYSIGEAALRPHCRRLQHSYHAAHGRKLLGFTNVAVYAASLDEWAADAANPMELGEESGKYDKD